MAGFSRAGDFSVAAADGVFPSAQGNRGRAILNDSLFSGLVRTRMEVQAATLVAYPWGGDRIVRTCSGDVEVI